MTTQRTALDAPGGDLMIADNDFRIATGVPAIAQQCEQELKFILGEWDFDTRRGVDYRRIWDNTRDYDLLTITITRHVRSVEGVLAVDDLRLVITDTRLARITATVTATDGQQFPLDVSI